MINELYEAELLEASFTNKVNLDNHYDKHVLKPDEDFNPDDPKFPFMSKEEYNRRAEILSTAVAGDSNDRVSEVIGWVVDDPEWPSTREIKIKRNSEFNPDYIEVVAYIGDEKYKGSVTTYFMAKRSNLVNQKRRFVAELPENRPKLDSSIK